MLALPGGVKGSWFCLLTACSASTAAAGNSFQTISPIVVSVGAADPANPGVVEGSFSAQLENPIGKVDSGLEGVSS